MAALKAEYELACQTYVLNGGCKADAYRTAWPERAARWKTSTLYNKCQIFFNRPEVQQRIRELEVQATKVADEKFRIDAQYVLTRVSQIDQLDVLDIMDADTGALLPVTQWPREWRTLISGIDVAEIAAGRGDNRRVLGQIKKLKWPDKIKNLELMGRHVDVQAFRDQLDHTSGDGTMSPTGKSWRDALKDETASDES